MKTRKTLPGSILSIGIQIAILILATTGMRADAIEKVLHRFRATDNDGLAPYGRLLSDASGNLYGTTSLGGAYGAGIAFELVHPKLGTGWTENVLYNFTGGNDGSQPYSGLIFDQSGSLYGTTYRGGTADAGTVYRLTPPDAGGESWTETVLYSFANGSDGLGPQSDLIFDQAGNLYGTTDNGGSPGNGIVFELTPPAASDGTWSETVLHRFSGKEGESPRAAVILGEHGELYGTLANGGAFGSGAVFELDPPATPGGTWVDKTIYTFSGGADGSGPLCRLIFFKGKLYGTTVIGGAFGVGAVFQLTRHTRGWTETVLHSFTCGNDGCYPWAGLVTDNQGTFYGTTQFGGLPNNGGTVFQIKQQGNAWTETPLYSFKLDGNQLAAAGVIRNSLGALHGVTIGSGMNAGMVFRISP